MFFVSHLLGADIMDSADKTVGKVWDLVCRPNGEKYPPLVAVVYKQGKEMKAFGFGDVENIGKGEISLNTLAGKVAPYGFHAHDVWLARDILDKQIVDLQGTRVVRVNDLRISFIEGEFRILGIDVSTRGLLRRMGLDRYAPFSWFKSTFIDWEKVQVMGKALKLSNLSEELVKLHPADLANIVEDLNPNQSNRLLQALDAKMAAKVFEELEPEAKQQILKSLDSKKLSGIISHIPVDELVDYMKTLTMNDRRKIMSDLSDVKKKTVQEFLQYEDNTAGGLMTTEFVKAKPAITVAEAREHVREVSEGLRSINFIYIVNEKNELLGIVSMRSLIVYPHEQKLRSIMKKIRAHQTVHVDADIAHIAKIMTKYNLHTVAVVDTENKLVGLVTVDDILRHFVPKA